MTMMMMMKMIRFRFSNWAAGFCIELIIFFLIIGWLKPIADEFKRMWICHKLKLNNPCYYLKTNIFFDRWSYVPSCTLASRGESKTFGQPRLICKFIVIICVNVGAYEKKKKITYINKYNIKILGKLHIFNGRLTTM